MGITIHYRGTIDRLELIEDFEDHVIDLAFAMGGQATVWRSYADHDSRRIVRGLMLEMTPGQETMSLLISPKGHLTNLFEIEEAEQRPTTEPSWCFVKTQFGSWVGHVSVVYLLDALKAKYFSNLEVQDEGDFYIHRDAIQLASKIKQLGDAIRLTADSFRDHGLSEEAAEDPAILIARIERIAQLVAKKMNTPVSKPPETPSKMLTVKPYGMRDSVLCATKWRKASRTLSRTMKKLLRDLGRKVLITWNLSRTQTRR